MSNTYENLKQRLIEIQNSRKDFLNLKTQKIKLINSPSEKGNKEKKNKFKRFIKCRIIRYR